MKLSKLIKKINVENTPPSGWNDKDKIRNNDPFGFNKAINYDKLNDPKVVKDLMKIFGNID